MIDETWTPESDTRVIEPAHENYNARLVRRVDHTDDLATFWVKFDGDPTPFESGQYMTIGVYVDGKIVQRPYSIASPPDVAGTEGYEMYVRLVPIPRFTTLLWRLKEGAAMRMIGPKGRFTLEPEDSRTHLFVSTGTGIAPFIAMMRHQMMVGDPRRVVMLNGASYVDELGYREMLESWERDGKYPLRYVPTVSRPSHERNAGWTGKTGRVENVLLETVRELELDPSETVVYICGNPDMIVNVEQMLLDSGYPQDSVKTELYWPKGKTVTAQPGVAATASS